MHATLLVLNLLGIALEEVCSRRLITSYADAYECHSSNCSYTQFNCNCENSSWKKENAICIPALWLCDGWKDCDNNADEMDCQCPPHYFQCGSNLGGGRAEDWFDQYNCIPDQLTSNTFLDCFNWKDEIGTDCESLLARDPELRCDMEINCLDSADEMNCVSYLPLNCSIPCTCNKPGSDFSCTGTGITCYNDDLKCDGKIDCTDGSDEYGCTCKHDQFTCQCYRNHPNSCIYGSKGCIPVNQYRNGKEDCRDGSDEREYIRKTKCGPCDVTVRRLESVEECETFADCDITTCVIVPALNCSDYTDCNETEAICTSHCDSSNPSQLCDTIFQCEQGYIDIAHNFCDVKIDCPDRSDEIRQGYGFKCFASYKECVLPQRNLYDNVAQCDHPSDLCPGNSCFECLDGKHNISQAQLCDRVIDCFDLSDECLCELHFDTPICLEMFQLNDPSNLDCRKANPLCQNVKALAIEKAQCKNQSSGNLGSFSSAPLVISCQTKVGEALAQKCDRRPKCKYFEDECSCDNPPRFCNDSCHNYYPLGDRYCDGIIDEAWKYINDTSCPKGFDETFCPERFSCKAGNLVSIDRVHVCDGIKHCDDGLDEGSCVRYSIFSSETEMIESIALRSTFWIMAVIVIVGNISVIFSTARLICKTKMSELQKFNHILILNLNFSDILMGFYLLIISIKSVQYSGHYEKFDSQWRTSLTCSIVGSLAVISSESSCYTLTTITAFRLYNVFSPFTARTASTLKWKLLIIFAWSVSLSLGFIPILKMTSYYFVYEIWFYNSFSATKEVWNKTEIMAFACRLASLSNHTMKSNGDAWASTLVFLDIYFPEYLPKGEFSYYGETSVCMPRIYVENDDPAWGYSFATVTFKFVAFLFVLLSYIIFYFKTSHRPVEMSVSEKQNAQMQKRIARLIATDFLCWVPICIMVFMKTAGVELSNVVYIVSAGVLLPINSALNPLLYSSVLERYLKQITFHRKKNFPQEIRMRS